LRFAATTSERGARDERVEWSVHRACDSRQRFEWIRDHFSPATVGNQTDVVDEPVQNRDVGASLFDDVGFGVAEHLATRFVRVGSVRTEA
jgi:hypothetical protein